MKHVEVLRVLHRNRFFFFHKLLCKYLVCVINWQMRVIHSKIWYFCNLNKYCCYGAFFLWQCKTFMTISISVIWLPRQQSHDLEQSISKFRRLDVLLCIAHTQIVFKNEKIGFLSLKTSVVQSTAEWCKAPFVSRGPISNWLKKKTFVGSYLCIINF